MGVLVQDRSSQLRSSQSAQVMLDHVRTVRSSGQVRPVQVRSAQVCQLRSGQVGQFQCGQLGQIRSVCFFQINSGQNRSGQFR